ncbi:MAG: type II CAAX endopeptidase family protein [Acidobacteriaceae bacterium]
MSLLRGPGRMRAAFRFLLAVGWLAVAYFLSEKAAHGFTHGAAFPLIRNIFEIFLLILGYSYMELSWDNAADPLRAMGLALRSGAEREFAQGVALGWGMVVAVFIVIVLGGSFYVRLSGSAQDWGKLVLQLLILAGGSLAAELAFRGYPFQKLIQATGPFTATVLAAVFFGLLRIETPGATPAAMWVSGVAAILLSVAYLRTRALWLGWGLHFAWLASISLLFGQPLAGSRDASAVVRSYVDGPTWLTGGEYGPEASLITLLVLWIGLYALVRVTRDLAWRYTHPEIKPAGVPMENGQPISARTPTPAMVEPSKTEVGSPSAISEPSSSDVDCPGPETR